MTPTRPSEAPRRQLALSCCLAAALVCSPVPESKAQCAGFSGQAKLTASDAAATDRFGHAVAASGDTVVVGAFREGDLGTFAGAAWVGVTSGGSWTEQAKLFASDGEAFDNFGTSVAIDGDTIVVGSPRDDDIAADAGAVFVFVRSGGLWSEEAKLTAADGGVSAGFGSSVALDGDTVVIGAPFDLVAGQNRGSAYAFVREAGAWRQQGKLTTTAIAATAALGTSVGLSGDIAIAGAPDDNDASFSSGSAHVFLRSGDSWALDTELRAADETTGDAFGHAVACFGERVLIGAFGDDDSGDNSGSAYTFVRAGGTWVEDEKLLASDGNVGDQFGRAVAIVGSLALVGARGCDDAGNNSGAAYLFVDDGMALLQNSKLLAADADALDQFGSSVGLGDGLAVAGAEDDDDGGSGSGSAHVFCFSAAESDCGDGIDDDGDGLTDCDDPDCQAPEVTRLDVAKDPASLPDGVTLTAAADSGATSWDVASELLSVLHRDRAAMAPCVATDLPTPQWNDSRALSADGFYYLLRAGPCAPAAGWGADSFSALRPACP